MKKYILTFILALFIAVCPLSLTACDKDNDSKNSVSISKIEIDGDFKNVYFVGEELDISDVEIKVTKSDDSSENITLTTEMISGFDSTTAGEKELTITYNKKTCTVSYTVKEPSVTEISLTSTFKTAYFTDDTLDISNGKIIATYDNGETEEVDITTEMISEFSTETAGEKELTITYGEKTISVSYSVTEIVVTSITVKTPFKTTYYVGDPLDVTNGKITVSYNNQTTKDISITNQMVSGFNSTSAGNKTATITYGSKTCTVNYSVTAVVETSISIHTHFKTLYVVGDELDVSNGKIIVFYNNNTKKEVDILDSMVSGFDSREPVENQVLTISYKGKTTTIECDVIELAATSLEFIDVDGNFKKSYFKDEPLDVSNGKIKVSYNNNTEDTIDITDNMVSNFSSYFEGEFEFTISYMGSSTKVAYTVSLIKVVSVELITTQDFKTTYYKGEPIDLSNAKIIATYNNGNTREIAVDESMVTAFSTSKAKTDATGKITTEFEDTNGDFMTVSFTYSVIDRAIKITGTLKSEFIVGETLNLDEITITITYGDETPDKELSADEKLNIVISGFNTNTPTANGTTRTFKIVYDGIQSKLFSYTVVENV